MYISIIDTSLCKELSTVSTTQSGINNTYYNMTS